MIKYLFSRYISLWLLLKLLNLFPVNNSILRVVLAGLERATLRLQDQRSNHLTTPLRDIVYSTTTATLHNNNISPVQAHSSKAHTKLELHEWYEQKLILFIARLFFCFRKKKSRFWDHCGDCVVVLSVSSSACKNLNFAPRFLGWNWWKHPCAGTALYMAHNSVMLEFKSIALYLILAGSAYRLVQT